MALIIMSSRFKPTYETKFSRQYRDMFSDNPEDRIRCSRGCDIRLCRYYLEDTNQTTNFIEINKEMPDKCHRTKNKIVNMNRIKIIEV